MQEYIDEAEETLSLSDLQISNAVDSEEFYTETRSSTSFDQDFFGFFTEEWSTTSSISSNPPENIIFCGKLISSKQPIITNNTQKPKTENQTNLKQKSKRLFRWNSDNFFCKRSKSASNPITSRSKSLPVPRRSTKSDGKNDILAKRVSILSSPTKSRWFLFMFGSGRVPTKMELSDIRSRQLKQSPSTMFRSEEESVTRRNDKGLWWWISVLGCGGGYDGNTMVKTSFGCLSHV